MLVVKMMFSGVAVGVVLLGSAVSAVPTSGHGLKDVARALVSRVNVGAEVFPVIAEPKNYCESILYHINAHRLNHSAPLLSYNRTLETELNNSIKNCQAPGPASTFANSISPWFSGGGMPTGDLVTRATEEVSQAWYDLPEIQQYQNVTDNWTKPPVPSSEQFPSPGLGLGLDQNHFLRMIWKGQKSIACATVTAGCFQGSPFFDVNCPPGACADNTWAFPFICAFISDNDVLGSNVTDYVNNLSGPVGLPTQELTSKNVVDSKTC